MEWMKIKKYKTDGAIICRSEDIDYVSSCNNDIATLHLKNGEYFNVELANLFELLRHVEKIQKNTLYGMSVARLLPDWDPENLRKEIEDLKLENDRLKQRDDIMVKFIRSVRCIGIICDKCDFHDDARHCCLFDHGSMSKEVSDLYMVFSDKAEEILERLDNL